MKTNVQLLSLCIVAASATGSSYASDAIGPGDSDSRWVLGGTAAVYTNIYAGEDNEGVLFPNFIYNGDRFFVKNQSLNLAIAKMDQLSGGLTIRPDGSYLSDDDEYDDNVLLDGLIERDGTIEGGFYVFHTTDMGRLSLVVLTDLASEHDGETLNVKYTFDLKYGGWYVNPSVGFTVISDDKINHLYGVSLAEQTQIRNAYEGDTAFNAFAGIRGRYEFTENWDLNLETGVVRLDSTIRNSPIVDEDYFYHASAAVSYNF
jgi:MipA family protein